jgi:hypothetical protein
MLADPPIDFDSKTADTLDTLLELKASIPTSIIKQRSSKRLEIRTKVVMSPGNSTERVKFQLEGVTGDISRGGCQIVFPETIGVGDVFWLRFPSDVVVNSAVLARCIRCCYINEDSFETGFRFFDPIQLRPQI